MAISYASKINTSSSIEEGEITFTETGFIVESKPLKYLFLVNLFLIACLICLSYLTFTHIGQYIPEDLSLNWTDAILPFSFFFSVNVIPLLLILRTNEIKKERKKQPQYEIRDGSLFKNEKLIADKEDIKEVQRYIKIESSAKGKVNVNKKIISQELIISIENKQISLVVSRDTESVDKAFNLLTSKKDDEESSINHSTHWIKQDLEQLKKQGIKLYYAFPIIFIILASLHFMGYSDPLLLVTHYGHYAFASFLILITGFSIKRYAGLMVKYVVIDSKGIFALYIAAILKGIVVNMLIFIAFICLSIATNVTIVPEHNPYVSEPIKPEYKTYTITGSKGSRLTKHVYSFNDQSFTIDNIEHRFVGPIYEGALVKKRGQMNLFLGFYFCDINNNKRCFKVDKSLFPEDKQNNQVTFKALSKWFNKIE